MNGLFAYRNISKGEIIAQYTGTVLSKRAAHDTNSDYLFQVFYRSRAGADTAVHKVIDGKGQLAGFGNHAPDVIANAEAVDILPTIIKNGVPYSGRHALVIVAKRNIPAGAEIRYDYNSNDDDVMVSMMMSKYGLTRSQIENGVWRTVRWVTPPDTGIRQPDFELDHVP